MVIGFGESGSGPQSSRNRAAITSGQEGRRQREVLPPQNFLLLGSFGLMTIIQNSITSNALVLKKRA
jgi:hypothetical protein